MIEEALIFLFFLIKLVLRQAQLHHYLERQKYGCSTALRTQESKKGQQNANPKRGAEAQCEQESQEGP